MAFVFEAAKVHISCRTNARLYQFFVIQFHIMQKRSLVICTAMPLLCIIDLFLLSYQLKAVNLQPKMPN